ncbi:sulfite exporter TauE/SafE family protein [soil metagenome]
MIPSVAAILAASLLGSVHCAAMCGGFVCFYTGSAPRDASLVRAHILYHAGRLVSYVMLGALAGLLGAGVARAGVLAGIGHAASLVAGLLMVAWAATTIAAQGGVRLRLPSVPQAWPALVGGVLQRLRGQPLAVRAAVTGIATTLIPCGWLYVYVAVAGGTGQVLAGMLVMAVFWVGTVPALAAVGVGAQRTLGPLRARLPLASAVIVLVIGMLAISGRLASTGAAMVHGH